jgi:hypothetical protein
MRERIRVTLKSALERTRAAIATVRSRAGATNTHGSRRDWGAAAVALLLIFLGGFFGSLAAGVIIRWLFQ